MKTLRISFSGMSHAAEWFSISIRWCGSPSTYSGHRISVTHWETWKGIKVDRLIKMCLFHDLPEARTGDLNYVNKKYVDANEKKAIEDLAQTVPFGTEIQELIHEFIEGKTDEAKLARDADQLEMILALKEYKDLGNKYADEWLEFSLKRLQTDTAKGLAKTILDTDSSLWWFSDKGDWWVSGGKR
jgi:putative hydrolase of HD superfamily